MLQSESLYFTSIESQLGRVLVAGDHEGLRRICFAGRGAGFEPERHWRRLGEEDTAGSRVVSRGARELEEYLAGRRKVFTVAIAPRGTTFQQRVWSALCRVSYGSTVSYGQLARSIGRPTASRAVGAAGGRNPLPIVVPCHRVVGADGRLVGYACGLDLKQKLLALEARGAPAGRALEREAGSPAFS